jgi:transposase
MVIQEEIKRLKELGHSQRKVTKLLGIHRSTVRKYWDSPAPLPPNVEPPWVNQLDWNHLASEIENKTTMKILHEELSQAHDLPTYSSFCRILAKKIENKSGPQITLRIPRIPGESVETDYSGESISILCPSTGEIKSTELFVGTMSCSSKIYAEFSESQRLEDWIGSHNRMFKYFGGVPKFEICDNLKSGVTETDKYDPEINRTFNDMARHYGLAIDPADRYSPKHKPNVEKSVDILQRDFFPRVRNRTFTSLHELNKSLWEYLEIKNSEEMKERGGSRDFFFEEEKKFLKPLPENPYEIFYWKKAKVHPDCHFQLKYNFYSVPHIFVGKEIDLKFNSKMVYASFQGEQIYCHKIPPGKSHFVTNEKHYPEKKIVDLQINIQALYKKAEGIGVNTHLLTKRLFDMPKFPLKNLRKVQAVINLSAIFSKEAMEYASESALELNKYTYNFIKSCAKNFRPKKENRIYQAPYRQLELICLQGVNNE